MIYLFFANILMTLVFILFEKYAPRLFGGRRVEEIPLYGRWVLDVLFGVSNFLWLVFVIWVAVGVGRFYMGKTPYFQ